MIFESLKMPNCFLINFKTHVDTRGNFIKLMHESTFKSVMTPTLAFKESYISFSYSGAIRGMHFQLPPFEHSKLVICLTGSVIDLLLDLRIGSPTYLQFLELKFDALDTIQGILLPPGIAHGFLSVSDAQMLYFVETEYQPTHDTGVRWDSFGYTWPKTTPIISERDKGFQKLDDFRSPFRI